MQNEASADELNKKLAKNTLIYFIANFSTKILSFLLVPIYTTYLSTSEFGNVDIVFTVAQLLQPILTLQLTQATFRYLFDIPEEKKKCYISTSFVAIVLMHLVSFLLSLPYVVSRNTQLLYLGALYILVSSLSGYLLQMYRGMKYSSGFAFIGFLASLVQIVCNILFVSILRVGSVSLLLAATLSSVVTIVVVLLSRSFYKNIDLRSIQFGVMKELLRFSFPLIPSTVIWWFMTGFAKFYIKRVLGASALGIYAMANKFSDILIVLVSIFNMAWTEVAYTVYESEKCSEYYSTVFFTLAKFVFSALAFGIPVTKVVIGFLLRNDYSQAIKYLPVMYVMVVLNTFAMFLASAFQITKATQKGLIATVAAAVTNVVLCVALVGKYGIWGAISSLICAQVVLFISSRLLLRNILSIRIDYRAMAVYAIMPLLSLGLYYIDNVYVQIALSLIFLFAGILINKNLLLGLLKMVGKKKYGVI